jgi:monoamine oxidase
MNKSMLGRRLGRLMRLAHYANQNRLTPRELDEIIDDPGRRAFIRRMALGAAGLAASANLRPLGAIARAAGAGPRIAQAATGAEPVVIIGGGGGGMAAGYTLKKAGIPFRIYEAASRVGGRIFTARNVNADGQFFERGAELVDTGHTTLIGLAHELGLEIEDFTTEPGTKDRAQELYHIDGRLHTEHEFVHAARPLLAAIAQANREMFGDGPPRMLFSDPHNDAFLRHDRTSMRDFLDRQTGVDEWVRKTVDVAYLCEYGRELDEQSSLNLIATIGTDPDHFMMFGESDESKRVKGGNDGLIAALKDAVTGGKADEDQGQILFRHQLVAIRDQASGFLCTFQTPSGNVEVRTRQVICAMPFSILRDVDGVGSLDLSKVKKRAIFNYQLGTNSKVVNSFRTRVWRQRTADHPAFGGVVYDSTEIQNYWEASRLQAGDRGLLTALLGGRIGLNTGNDSIEKHARLIGESFPEAAQSYEGIGLAMNWTKMPFNKGSYTCMAPGQHADFCGAAGLPELGDRMLFAGEHASIEHYGYMNGAYETGVAAANAVIEKAKSAKAAA